MSFVNHPGHVSDLIQIPVAGSITIGDGYISFNPSAEMSQYAVSVTREEIKSISVSDIGYRAEAGPFFEFTVYLKEQGRLYSFGDFECSKKEELLKQFEEQFGQKAFMKEISPIGWNWGELHVNKHQLAFCPEFMDDISSDASNQEEQEEQEEKSQNDLEVEYFHMPIELVSDFQKIGAKDLQVEFKSLDHKNQVYVKSLTFGFPDEDFRNQKFLGFARNVSQTETQRVLLLEQIQCHQPSGKHTLEFGQNYFKLSANREISREPKDVARIYLLDKDEDNFYLAVQLIYSKKTDYDILVMEVTQKRENREVLIPESGAERDRLIQELQIENFTQNFIQSENDGFPQDCILETQQNIEKKNSVKLRSVPQFLTAFLFFKALCPGVNIVMTEEARQALSGTTPTEFSYIRCAYKRPNREYQIYVLKKNILVMPVDVLQLSIANITYVKYEKDFKHSNDLQSFIKLIISMNSGQHYEFTKIDGDQIKVFDAKIRSAKPGIQIVDEFKEEGGRKRQMMDDEEEDADDEEWQEEDEESSNKYEYSSESVQSEHSQSVDKKAAEKPKKEKPKKAAIEYEEIEGVRPEDATREVGWPKEWIGLVHEEQVIELSGDDE